MRRTILIVTVLTGAMLAVRPAPAAFNVCHQSSLAVRVARGGSDGPNGPGQGWWTIPPSACAGLLTGPLVARYYYLYATDGAAGTWEGHTHFCVTPSAKFLAPGRSD